MLEVVGCGIHDGAHSASGHADITEGRAGYAKLRDGGGGSFVYRDVVGMPVEAVHVERDDDVWPEPADGAEDVRLEPHVVDPGEHAILVVEQYEVANAENPCGIPQLAGPNVAKPLGVVFRTVLAIMARTVFTVMPRTEFAVMHRTVFAMREAEE